MLQHFHHVDEREAAVSRAPALDAQPSSPLTLNRSILESQYKTVIVGVSCLITVTGWWAWNAFLSFAYGDNISPFDVRGGFQNAFGRDPQWWLVLVAVVAVLVVTDLIYKSLRHSLAAAGRWPPWKHSRTAEELEVSVWQEMERDPVIRAKLHRLARDGDYDDDDDDDDGQPDYGDGHDR